MDDLFAARTQMALSLGFHIVFAVIGMAMPFLVSVAHYKWLRSGQEHFYTLTRAWLRGVAIFFAVGAVSGTVLSFELGLLWPTFMQHAGPIVGMPFSLEGAAFFLEAIAIGLYLYGWNRIHPWLHWSFTLVIGVSGVLSGAFVVCANAWMNSPAGFDWNNGNPTNIEPVAAMFNAAALSQCLHMTVAAFEATAFGVVGVHALSLLRHPQSQLHQAALRIALVFAAVSALIQPLTGDFSAKDVARRQPIKLAAMEALFETRTHAPLLVGGMPDPDRGTVAYAIELPGMLSFLAYGSTSAEVRGLREFPRDTWPPVRIVHIAFQIMVGCGTLLAVVGGAALALAKFRPSWLYHKRFLWLLVLCCPLGFVALEAGWTVTEVGRQPWIIYGLMRTKDALTPMPGVGYSLALYCGVYLLLTVVVIFLMRRQIRHVD
jgi:cytochrome bd ubiquinol oxidase subunit I